jgi:hypothetical protein
MPHSERPPRKPGLSRPMRCVVRLGKSRIREFGPFKIIYYDSTEFLRPLCRWDKPLTESSARQDGTQSQEFQQALIATLCRPAHKTGKSS